jgi:hypothetical protein
MIRDKNEKPSGPIEIDLSGPKGNTFELAGIGRNIGKQLGFSNAKLEKINKEMFAHDYENVLKVFEYYYGDYVILWR